MNKSWKNGLILRNILKMIENWPKWLKLIFGPTKKSTFRRPWASTLVSWPTFHIMIKRYHLPKKDQQEGHLPYRDPIGILNLDSQISLQKYKFSFSFFWIPKFREGRWIKPPQPPSNAVSDLTTLFRHRFSLVKLSIIIPIGTWSHVKNKGSILTQKMWRITKIWWDQSLYKSLNLEKRI